MGGALESVISVYSDAWAVFYASPIRSRCMIIDVYSSVGHVLRLSIP